MEEVQRQTHSLQTSINAVNAKTDGQNELLSKFEHWRKALWGNGTGPPGYLERARAEDKENYSELKRKLDELITKDLKSTGAEEERIRAEQEDEKSQQTRNRKYSRLMDVAKILLGSSAGAFLLEHIVKAFSH